MRTLFIIGNGFDINLGMKTRYTDFYDFYKEKINTSSVVKQLKENIASNYATWSDLELALGDYTAKINCLEEFDEVYEDICNHLAEYLDYEENNFNSSVVDKSKFFHYLCYPEYVLSRGDYDTITDFKGKWRGNHWNVDIITLNYTKIIEKIVVDFSKGQKIGKHEGLDIYLNSIEHIHGFTDNRMVLGLNDISQLKNELFHDNEEVIEGLIKSHCNSVHNHKIDRDCKQRIEKADLFYIFGCSLGDTDNCWWQLICEQLKKRDCKLIIFYKGQDISLRFGHKKNRIVREIKDYFISKTSLTLDEKIVIKEKIVVGVNTELFGGLLT